MFYFTRIPDTTYAQRHTSFLSEREEARRSLSNCQVMHRVMVKACEGKLSRNYLDAPALERATRQIVKISKTIRELTPVAEQPDPPRHEPVSAQLSAVENRTYNGVKASRLVRVLRFIAQLKRRTNDAVVALRILKMSDRLVGGLDVFRRVKALVENLTHAVDAPETAITPRANSKPYIRKVGVKWEVSPQKIYGWKAAYRVKGYDPRQTSVYWLEKQATTLKRAVYQEHHGITERAKVRPAQSSTTTEVRRYIPPQGAKITDEIWPPIDLVRMIEERRAFSAPIYGGSGREALEGGASHREVLVGAETNENHLASTTSRCSAPSDCSVSMKRSSHLPRVAVEEQTAHNNNTCHSVQFAMRNAREPRDIAEHSQNKKHPVFTGSRVKPCISFHELHWMTGIEVPQPKYQLKEPET